jgi:dynein light chain LC8-type
LKGEQAIQKIKNAMDKAWEPNWHVIVGKNFGSKVTHEARRFVYFYVHDFAVMLYKA